MAHERLSKLAPQTELVKSGIFQFLGDPSVPKFFLVSAFGIECVLVRKGNLETFVERMSKVIEPSGIVCIFPIVKNTDDLWRRNGFEAILSFSGPFSTVIYAHQA